MVMVIIVHIITAHIQTVHYAQAVFMDQKQAKKVWLWVSQ